MAGISTLTAIGVGLTSASAGLSAYSSYQSGKAQERAYNAQAEQDEANARVKAMETSINEDTLRRQKRAELARMSAAQGEAGLEGGTATTAYMSSFRNAEQNAMNLRYQGMSQWAAYKNQAALNRFYGRQAFKQGQMGAWMAGLQGLAQMGSMAAMSYTPNSSDLGKVQTLDNTTGSFLANASKSDISNIQRSGIFGGGIDWGKVLR